VTGIATIAAHPSAAGVVTAVAVWGVGPVYGIVLGIGARGVAPVSGVRRGVGCDGLARGGLAVPAGVDDFAVFRDRHRDARQASGRPVSLDVGVDRR
jgi:hypothetical protein